MKKGLRRPKTVHGEKVLHPNPRPDEEGIKTTADLVLVAFGASKPET